MTSYIQYKRPLCSPDQEVKDTSKSAIADFRKKQVK